MDDEYTFECDDRSFNDTDVVINDGDAVDTDDT